MIYPWQTEQWQQFSQRKSLNRLPHALLLTGMQGMGKAHFADAITRSLLCQKTQNAEPDAACVCHACGMLNGRAHPNVLWIEPEKPGQAIKVDPIREVTDFINQTSLHNGYRIVIINPANQMNVNAANALLKTLEEPSVGALLVLISHQDAGLPATILSRCQRLLFAKPNQTIAVDWLRQQIKETEFDPELMLAITEGGPLSVLTMLQDDYMTQRAALYAAFGTLSDKKSNPIAAASQMQSAELMTILSLSISFVMDCVRLQMHCDQSLLNNRDVVTHLSNAAARISTQKALQFLTYLNSCRRQLLAGINPNKALLIETIMINWRECF